MVAAGDSDRTHERVSPAICRRPTLRYAGDGKVAYTPRTADAEHRVQIVEAEFVLDESCEGLLPWSKVNGTDLTQWEGNDYIPWYSNAWNRNDHFYVRVQVYRTERRRMVERLDLLRMDSGGQGRGARSGSFGTGASHHASVTTKEIFR